MEKQEVIKRLISDVMENFDFEKVQRTMNFLDWKWYIGNGAKTVPSVWRLMKKAEYLLNQCAEKYGEQEFYQCGSGGLTASLDGNNISLLFILEEMTACGDDYKDE